MTGMIEPLAEDHENGFEFVNQIFGGAIPSEHIPACEKGFKDVMSKGPLAAFPMVGIKVTLNDGKYHDVDSSDLAYQLAARTAMRDAVKKSSPVLMEPVMKVEVETDLIQTLILQRVLMIIVIEEENIWSRLVNY